MSESNPDSGINVRSVGYLIARSAAVCPHCRDQTRVVGLLVPPGHETRSTDEEGDTVAEGPARCVDSWDRADRHAFLFYIESLPEAVPRRMQGLAPMFRFAASPAMQASYWANHCERCGAIQEDHDLFCEPEGAFVPLGPAAGSAIELVAVDDSLEAAAAGYSPDPEFIGFKAGA